MEKAATERSYYFEPDLAKNGFKEKYQIFFQQSTPGEVSAKAHIHNSIEFIYIFEGSFTGYLGDAEYTVSAGDLFLARSRVIHRLVAGSSENNSYYVVKISPSLLFDFAHEAHAAKYILNLKLGKNQKCVWRRDELENTPLKAMLNEVISEKLNDSYCSDIAVKSGCARILMHVLRETETDQIGSSTEATDEAIRLIYKAIEHINHNYKRKITALDCSKEIGMSYSYFSRTFKSVTGKSFSEFLSDTRLDSAKRHLLTTDKSVTEIAFDCGYSDACYFIAEFRRKTGTTPKQFRIKN